MGSRDAGDCEFGGRSRGQGWEEGGAGRGGAEREIS